MNKQSKQPGVMSRIADLDARYRDSVLQILVNQYDLSEKVAQDLVDHSTFRKMLRKNPEFVTHYSPEHWAEEIYEDYTLMA